MSSARPGPTTKFPKILELLAVIEFGEELCRPGEETVVHRGKGRGGQHPPRSAKLFTSHESRIQSLFYCSFADLLLNSLSAHFQA